MEIRLWPSLHHKGEIFCSSLSSALFLFYCSSCHGLMGAAPRWREEVIVLKIIYIWGGGSLGSLVGRVKGPAFVLVILVLRECI